MSRIRIYTKPDPRIRNPENYGSGSERPMYYGTDPDLNPDPILTFSCTFSLSFFEFSISNTDLDLKSTGSVIPNYGSLETNYSRIWPNVLDPDPAGSGAGSVSGALVCSICISRYSTGIDQISQWKWISGNSYEAWPDQVTITPHTYCYPSKNGTRAFWSGTYL